MDSFAELKLSPEMTQSLTEMGFTAPTPIQAQALPLLFEGPTDFLGMAATGTGKTAAFGIPLLEGIDASKRVLQGIVLCPTRELAVQTCEQINLLGKHKRIQALAVYGGTGFVDQNRALHRGVHVVVATPGRLIDHLKQKSLKLENVKTVVLDEADEMISMGFKEELEYLLSHLPPGEAHTWLFAATMSPELRRVADKYLRMPKIAQVNRTEMLSGTVKQIYYTVRDKNKPKALCRLLDVADDFYGLIFCQTKVQVTGLTEHLRARGYAVDSLHGDKNQSERERTLAAFKAKTAKVLVCSDVAARGLDVKELTHVINYSLPIDLDSYVHRIGRTGRSGKLGLAMSLVAPVQLGLLDRIQRRTKVQMEAGVLPTQEDIIAKRLSALLPKLASTKSHEAARKILDASWTETLEKMSKTEIAERMLVLAMPHLFDEREKAEELDVEEERRNRPRYDRPFRPSPRFDRRDDRGEAPRSFDRGPAPRSFDRRDDRGDRGGFRRDDRGPRPDFRRDDRGPRPDFRPQRPAGAPLVFTPPKQHVAPPPPSKVYGKKKQKEDSAPQA